MEIRKHKSERDLQGENIKKEQNYGHETIGRRSMGDRLDTFRGRLSTSIREDGVNDQAQNENEKGGRRSEAQSRAETIRAASPLPNFTLFDLPAGMLSGPLNGDLETNNEEIALDDASQGRTSFNIFRPSFDRSGNRARASKDGKLNFTRVEPSTANRSTIISSADNFINTEGNQRKNISKSVTPTSTQAGQHTNNSDTYNAQSINEDYDDEQIVKASKRALWKTDLVIMPLMALVVMLQYLDKAIFSYAALLGLVTDLKITMGQYSFAASIYYIGMISGLPLWTFVLQRVSADLSTGATVTLWGMVTMTHAATYNYSGILAVRFFLGFLESSVTPALVLITSMFYTPRETISRTAIWYAFNGVALILGGGLSYGLLTNPSVIKSSLSIWRQLYLILGGITIFVGLMLLAFMPNTPNRTRLYSPIERKAVLNRLFTQQPKVQDKNKTGKLATVKESNEEEVGSVQHTPYVKKTRKIAWYQWLEAICDVRLYLFFCGLLVGSIPNGGVTAYSTQLLSGFGFSQAETLLVSIAPGGGQIVSVLLFIITALITKSRILGANLLLFIAIAGSTMMYVSTTGRTAKTVGYVLLNFGSPAVVALYSFIGSAVLGHDKRVIFTIVSQLAYALGNIIGPLVFLESETLLNYPTAKKVIIGSLAGAAFTLFCIGIIHAAWNYKRNLNRDDSELEQQQQMQNNQDLSDFKRKDFRYVY